MGRVTATGGLLLSGSINPPLFLFPRRLIGLGDNDAIVAVVVLWVFVFVKVPVVSLV